MLISIGCEETKKSKQPWVALGIACLCVLIFLSTYFSSKFREEKSQVLLESAAAYFYQHPYLKIDARVERELLDPRQLISLKNLYSQFGRDLNPNRERLLQEQGELNAKTLEAFALLDVAVPRRFGYIPSRPSVLRLFSHIFIHAGWLHLAVNMVCLYFVGGILEREFGHRLFAGFFFLASAFSALLFSAHNQESIIPLVGTSGAAAGIVGVFLVHFLHEKITLVYNEVVSAPAWILAPLWLAWELSTIQPVDTMGAGGRIGTAYWAHAWGFLFGVASAFIMKYMKNEKLLAKPPAGARAAAMDALAVKKAMDCLHCGKREDAWRILLDEMNARPGSLAAAQELWNLALEMDRTDRAAPFFARMIKEFVRRGHSGEALFRWRELVAINHQDKVSLRTAVRLSELLAAEKNMEAAREVADRTAENLPSGASVGAMIRLARLASGQALVKTAEAILSRKELLPDGRIKIEKLLADGNLKISQSSSVDSNPVDEAKSDAPGMPLAEESRSFKVRKGTLVGISDDKLTLDMDDQCRAMLPLSKVKAVAAARIDHLIGPSLVVDILLDLPAGAAKQLRSIRCERSAIDPMETKEQAKDRENETLHLAALALERSGAASLPSKWSSDGNSLCIYDSIKEYEHAILARE